MSKPQKIIQVLISLPAPNAGTAYRDVEQWGCYNSRNKAKDRLIELKKQYPARIFRLIEATLMD